MTPEVESILTTMKRDPAKYEHAMALAMISDDPTKSVQVRMLAMARLGQMVDEAADCAGVKFAEKPKYVWRNGARVKA